MTVLTELSSISRSTQSEKDTHYKSGSIKRIKLKNFLTYDSVEFMPVSVCVILEKGWFMRTEFVFMMWILTRYTFVCFNCYLVV